MCILALSINNHPKYKLILASNRDEFFDRETQFAHLWEDTNIIAGKDLKEGGTWLGVNNNKFSILTNYRNPLIVDKNKKSRGDLVVESLLHGHIKDGLYNPFNLIFGDIDNLSYYTNMSNKRIKLENGIHVLSNGFLNEKWPKTEKLRKLFENAIKNDDFYEDLIKVMQDEEKFPIETLPNTNISKEMEYFLSSIFIRGEKYGTRATTIITVDNENNLKFIEISYNNKKEVINRFSLL